MGEGLQRPVCRQSYRRLVSTHSQASSAIRAGTVHSLGASVLDNKLVLDVRSVVLQVYGGDVLAGGLNFGPAVDFEAQVLLDHVGVGVADANHSTFLNDIELLVEGHHLDAAVLVTNDALSNAIQVATIVPTTLADDANRLDTEVHVDARAGLQLRHGNEDWLAQGRALLLVCGGLLGRFHFLQV